MSEPLAQRALGAVLLRLPLRAAIQLEFLVFHRRLPRLDHPRTFNEKIALRKLMDRDPRMPRLVDKIEAKGYVRELLGEEWVIPTVWCGSQLPERRERRWPYPYVLKASHGSGWNAFIHSAQDEDWDALERETRQWLRTRYRPYLGEWAYSQLQPRLLVEPFLGEAGISLPDYKFWVFGGRVAWIQVDTDRLTNHQQYFYDLEWNKQSFRYICPFPEGNVDPPRSLETMVQAAEVLARPFPFARVDLYEMAGRPLFGEMTFYPNSGRYPFKPAAVELAMGGLWPEAQGTANRSAQVS